MDIPYSENNSISIFEQIVKNENNFWKLELRTSSVDAINKEFLLVAMVTKAFLK